MVLRCTRTVILVVCALLLALNFFSPAHANSSPRVLAFYYAWFDGNTWSPNVVSDMPGLTYNSNDPAAIARHISQAQGAGIDAFVVSWIGTNNPTDWNLHAMLDRAAQVNFKATIDFEVQHFGSRDAVINALSYVRDNLESHPAFFRDGGKPVLFFWREQNYSVGDWAAIRAAVDPNHNQIWIAEGVDISYQQVFDGHHLYSIAWSPDPNYTLKDWSNRVRRAGANKLWVATVMPGYSDLGTGRSDKFARARNNGDYYRTTWQAALGSGPDWVIITSFNEWVEGSQIEPSVSYGNLYLDLTRQYAGQFKSGSFTVSGASAPASPAALAKPSAAISTQNAPTKSTLKSNQRTTTEILRVRSEPNANSEILGRLKVKSTVTIVARTRDGRWLQINYPDAKHPGWISAEFVTPHTDTDNLPVLNDDGSDPCLSPFSTPRGDLRPTAC